MISRDRAADDPLEQAIAETLAARRAALNDSGVDMADLPAPGSLGFAISGGGIRSATIGLGAIQGFARHERLLDFDTISTVSGGGYVGSFLTSLFLPGSIRGSAPAKDVGTDWLSARRTFAQTVLTLDARERLVALPAKADRGPGDWPPDHSEVIRNPVWWLREHGRYLAPSGAADYAMAATYIMRNWFAMVYVFALPIAAIALAAQLLLWVMMVWTPLAFGSDGALLFLAGLVRGEWITRCSQVGPTGPVLFSPIALLLMPLAVGSLVAGTGYWLTQWARPGVARQWVFVGGVAGTAIGLAVAASALAQRPSGCGAPAIDAVTWIAVGIAALAVLMALLISVATMMSDETVFVGELRRLFTLTATRFNLAMVAVAGLALVDTAALLLARTDALSIKATALGAIAPVGAWIVARLTGGGGGGDPGRWRRLVMRYVWQIALVVGLLLYGVLAVLVDAGVHAALWSGRPWPVTGLADAISGPNLRLYGSALAVLLLVTGWSTGFINLSSLHNLYAARLTRAYLGASNAARLCETVTEVSARPVTETHDLDDLGIAAYQQTRSAAPLHIVNVTLNETRSTDGSQFVSRDRKGVPVMFAPEGILVDPAQPTPVSRHFLRWGHVPEAVERLSVGQLCAISGAAASAGMGARTTLGGALALSFANIRLGYWWKVGDVLDPLRVDPSWGQRLFRIATRGLRTYFYLWNEMTARYSRDYERLHLSDGGHFDNSGAYELLRRKTPLIVVLDNGADPDYRFEDLAQLIRKARVDLGLSINAVPPDDVDELLGTGARDLFFNSDADWRLRAGRSGGSACALLLAVYGKPPAGSPPERRHRCHGYIIWLKPRLFDGLPQDVRGYAIGSPKFPQEPTGDQFFDEAQWESYRAVGQSLVESLLDTEAGADILRRAARLLT